MEGTMSLRHPDISWYLMWVLIVAAVLYATLGPKP